MPAMIPVKRQIRTVASRMLRRGFVASSERVEIPSNPMYVSTASEVPVETVPPREVLAGRRTAGRAPPRRAGTPARWSRTRATKNRRSPPRARR